MRVCVLGLWHLGTVTAACLAGAGHQVVGLDFDAETVAGLDAGRPPLHEPGLEDLVRQGLAAGALSFTTDPAEALRGAEVLWVTYDTPVDEQDRADTGFVLERMRWALGHLEPGALVLVSSQLPAGTTRRLESEFLAAHPDRDADFAYSPENLRLGRAIAAFTRPDRVVAGAGAARARARISDLFAPFSARIEWMSVTSAEMTKHALNAFLALSVAFANEIAGLCEEVGADAKDVERGLKSEARIGPRAYLAPGAAFAGGTLARDVAFLAGLGAQFDRPTPLLAGVLASNEAHKSWVRRTLTAALGSLAGRRVTVWGLTYKPGTDTLRRSLAIELCRWLAAQGATVAAYDPAVRELPADLRAAVRLHADPVAALGGAAALVIATEWPLFRDVPAAQVTAAMAAPVVIDPNRFLAATLAAAPIRYLTVGAPRATGTEGPP